MKMESVGEVWLSLEQASHVLGLPWSTLLRWARAGDPRLPAYRCWDESNPKLGSYRFKKQDVAALQTQTQDPAPHSSE
jgi:Helix-turn-helix domain